MQRGLMGILIAGSHPANETAYIVMLELGKYLSIVHREELPPSSTYSESRFNNAVCSPSGLVAYSKGYGRQIVLYQLNQAHDKIDSQFALPLSDGIYNSTYGTNMLIEEN